MCAGNALWTTYCNIDLNAHKKTVGNCFVDAFRQLENPIRIIYLLYNVEKCTVYAECKRENWPQIRLKEKENNFIEEEDPRENSDRWQLYSDRHSQTKLVNLFKICLTWFWLGFRPFVGTKIVIYSVAHNVGSDENYFRISKNSRDHLTLL